METLQPHAYTCPCTFMQERKLEKMEWERESKGSEWVEQGVDSKTECCFLFLFLCGVGVKLLFYILHRIYKLFPCLSPDGDCTRLWGFWPGKLGWISGRSMCPSADPYTNLTLCCHRFFKEIWDQGRASTKNLPKSENNSPSPMLLEDYNGGWENNKCPI